MAVALKVKVDFLLLSIDDLFVNKKTHKLGSVCSTK